MRAIAVASLLALAACGQPSSAPQSGDVAARHADACALIASPAAIFGEGAQVEPDSGLDDMAGTCRFTASDARRGGDVIVYNAASLGAVTPQAKLADVVSNWGKATFTPAAPVEKLGDEAQILTDLPGQQVQLAFRKGAFLVLIAGRSGDEKKNAEAIARELAAQAAASPALASR